MITAEELVRMGPARALAHIRRFQRALRCELDREMNVPAPDREHIAFLIGLLADLDRHLPSLPRTGRA